MLTLSQWREQGIDLDVDGRRIFVVDSGGSERPVIFFLHGFPTAGWDIVKLWPLLVDDYRLVVPDLLGFGFSAKPRRHNYTIHEQADLMEGVANALSLPRHHLLAHDYGVSVAQEMLARDNARGAQRRWRSLCLLNGGLFPETHRARPIQKLLHGPLGAILVRLMNRRTLERNLRAVFGRATPPSDAELDAFWSLICANDGRFLFHRLIRYMRDRRHHRQRWLDALTGAKIPLQLINGSADPVSGAHMVARYRQLVGDANIVELPAIGHYPHMEAAADVAREYRQFLAAIDQGEMCDTDVRPN